MDKNYNKIVNYINEAAHFSWDYQDYNTFKEFWKKCDDSYVLISILYHFDIYNDQSQSEFVVECLKTCEYNNVNLFTYLRRCPYYLKVVDMLSDCALGISELDDDIIDEACCKSELELDSCGYIHFDSIRQMARFVDRYYEKETRVHDLVTITESTAEQKILQLIRKVFKADDVEEKLLSIIK